jgi:uncharacterized LabA/DUF88 family protein
VRSGTAGWRWLDLRALATTLASARWAGCSIERIVYCTARVSGRDNPSGAVDQDVYLKALAAAGSIDHIEYGYYVSRVKAAPLATSDKKGRPVLTRSARPVVIKDAANNPVPDAVFIVCYARREEKASDVNVATHLLLDVLAQRVDAVIVVSNDSDLRLPIIEARGRVAVGTINPSPSYTAGALKGHPNHGVGGHWWTQLQEADIRAHQLPNPVGKYSCPQGW